MREHIREHGQHAQQAGVRQGRCALRAAAGTGRHAPPGSALIQSTSRVKRLAVWSYIPCPGSMTWQEQQQGSRCERRLTRQAGSSSDRKQGRKEKQEGGGCASSSGSSSSSNQSNPFASKQRRRAPAPGSSCAAQNGCPRTQHPLRARRTKSVKERADPGMYEGGDTAQRPLAAGHAGGRWGSPEQSNLSAMLPGRSRGSSGLAFDPATILTPAQS